MDEETKAGAQAAQDRLDAEVKAKYGSISKVSHTLPDGTVKTAYFKAPNRSAFGVFLAQRDQNLVTACEALYIGSVIKEVGDAQYFLEDNAAFYGIMYQLIQLVEVKKSAFTTF